MVRNIIRKIGYTSSVFFLSIYPMNRETIFTPLPQEQQFALICADGAVIYPASSLCAELKDQSALISQEMTKKNKRAIHLTTIKGEQLLTLLHFIEAVASCPSLSQSLMQLIAKRYMSLNAAQRHEVINTASMLQCHALHKLLCLTIKKSNL